ncbi:MAG: hypothetical protein WCV99_10670 [Sterolibacterium sp.]|jgi:hypothetical protein
MKRTITLLTGLLAALSVQAQPEVADPASTPKTQTRPTSAMPHMPEMDYQSALSKYRAFQDEKISSWKASNDNVARIGGWRAYAREASEPEPASRNTGRETPAATAGHPNAGHGK